MFKCLSSQGADFDPVLDGVLLLGLPGGRPPLDHHDALGPLQICYNQGHFQSTILLQHYL